MLLATEQIRRMRGGAQSHLMRCSDGHYYVVKFQNNPQHTRILVNELLATRLAARLGLPTTPGSGIFRMPRCVACTRATASTKASSGGRRLIRGWSASKKG